jgi:hypothetical protein
LSLEREPRIGPLNVEREPRIGWRVWNVRVYGKKAILFALNNTPVEPFVKATAWCSNGRNCNHNPFDAASLHCQCGFYSYKTFKLLAQGGYSSMTHDSGVVVGKVKLWGRISEYTEGWRAQYMYPFELVTPRKDVAELLEHTYGVKCEVANIGQMISEVNRKVMEEARRLAGRNELPERFS